MKPPSSSQSSFVFGASAPKQNKMAEFPNHVIVASIKLSLPVCDGQQGRVVDREVDALRAFD
jgi:hypothetical protein